MIKSPIFSLNYHDYLIIFLCNFHEISWVLYVRMSEIHMSHDILIWYSHEINISIYVRSHLISQDFFHDLSWDFSVRALYTLECSTHPDVFCLNISTIKVVDIVSLLYLPYLLNYNLVQSTAFYMRCQKRNSAVIHTI